MSDSETVNGSIAAVKLGMSLGEQGDLDGAQAAFQRAVDSSDTATAAWAAWGLGKIFIAQDDPQAAIAAFRKAIDSREPGAAPQAALELGLSALELGLFRILPKALTWLKVRSYVSLLALHLARSVTMAR